MSLYIQEPLCSRSRSSTSSSMTSREGSQSDESPTYQHMSAMKSAGVSDMSALESVLLSDTVNKPMIFLGQNAPSKLNEFGEYVPNLPVGGMALDPVRREFVPRLLQPPRQELAGSPMYSASAAGPNSALPEDCIYKVQYKTCARHHMRSPYFGTNYPKEGDFVIVEADRGIDLGMVVGAIPLGQYYRQMHFGNGSEAVTIDDGKILRVATLRETQQVPLKGRDEEEVFMYCSHLIQRVYNLPMTVMDTEFQFDRNKLTITYVADNRIDFREMVRDLYGRFKARIWMKQLFNESSRRGPSSLPAAVPRSQFHVSYGETEKSRSQFLPSYRSAERVENQGLAPPPRFMNVPEYSRPMLY